MDSRHFSKLLYNLNSEDSRTSLFQKPQIHLSYIFKQKLWSFVWFLLLFLIHEHLCTRGIQDLRMLPTRFGMIVEPKFLTKSITISFRATSFRRGKVGWGKARMGTWDASIAMVLAGVAKEHGKLYRQEPRLDACDLLLGTLLEGQHAVRRRHGYAR